MSAFSLGSVSKKNRWVCAQGRLAPASQTSLGAIRRPVGSRPDWPGPLPWGSSSTRPEARLGSGRPTEAEELSPFVPPCCSLNGRTVLSSLLGQTSPRSAEWDQNLAPCLAPVRSGRMSCPCWPLLAALESEAESSHSLLAPAAPAALAKAVQSPQPRQSPVSWSHPRLPRAGRQEGPTTSH